MKTFQPSRLLLACLLGLSFSATAADYFVVVPVKGKTQAPPVIGVTLQATTLPQGQQGQSYAGFDFLSALQVTGDAAYTGSQVSWSVVSGALPSGISLVGSQLSGVPDAAGSSVFSLQASYKGVASQQAYTLEVQPYQGVVLQPGGYRTWADGTVASSCQAYRNAPSGQQYSGAVGDGVYRIQPSGQPAMDAFCDMSTAGGGWTLVLNYLHKGGTNPALQVRANSLPVQASTTLGADGTLEPQSWGHASSAMVNSLAPAEVRFTCSSSYHGRRMDFSTSNTAVVSYVKTGVGQATGVRNSYTLLPGHTANLPAATNDGFGNNGDYSMTQFPFYAAAAAHWGIKGSGTRWECDDHPNNANHNTHHRIWVR